MNELISVIVPIYNTAEEFIEPCINSIINQTYSNLQIILVDDGSNQDYAEYLDTWLDKDNRIEICHKQNGGIGSARNAGLDRVKGEYVTFVDGDDWLPQNAIELLAINATDYDIVQGQKCKVLDGKKMSELKVDRAVLTGDDMLTEFMSPWVAIAWMVTTKLYKTKLIEKTRFLELQLWDDYIFNRSVLFGHPDAKVLTIPDVAYYYVLRSDSIMNSAKNAKQMKAFDAVIESTPESVLSNDKYLKWHQYFLFELAFSFCLSITKSGVAKEEYHKYSSYLKKNIKGILLNTHLEPKRKAGMVFCAVCPKIFQKLRESK